MGHQFDRVAYSSESSLTLIIDDLLRQRQAGLGRVAETTPEVEDWINALQRQSSSLLHSKAGRENLEAWLEQVEQLTAS